METGWGEAQTFNALGRRRAKFTWEAADSPQKDRAFLIPGPGSTSGHCWVWKTPPISRARNLHPNPFLLSSQLVFF